MVPLDSTEPPRSEVSKVKWFREGVSHFRKSVTLIELTCTAASTIQSKYSRSKIRTVLPSLPSSVTPFVGAFLFFSVICIFLLAILVGMMGQS